MTAITSLGDDGYKRVERQVQLVGRGKPTLEAAARAYSALLYEEFKESVVLSRLFATVPKRDLPASRAKFVDALARSAGVADTIDDTTLVLSLLGTAGSEPEWSDVTKSRGHVGIPLVSAAFVDAIPMVSRLLHQLGAGVDWIDRKDTSIVARALGLVGGVFFVQDAASEVDAQNRKVIAAQDFVAKYGVQSVFGFGGGYAGTQVFVVSITFLRDQIDKAVAERFLAHVDRFKVSTADAVRRNALFDA